MKSIDPAALAAATLAAGLSLMLSEGPWDPWSMAIGTTLLLLLFSYDQSPVRTWWQTAAFASVAAICLTIFFAFPLEWALERCSCSPPEKDGSRVTGYHLVPIWFFSGIVVAILDWFRVDRPPAPQPPENAVMPQAPVVTPPVAVVYELRIWRWVVATLHRHP